MTSLRFLGLIPARAGSKGLPGKNMRLLGTQPLLQYSIDAGLASRRLDRLIFSSDDAAMIAFANARGCGAPFVRPPALAEDHSGMVDVVLHAVDWLANVEGVTVENVVLLQPTQPFRNEDDIDGAISTFEASHTESLFSVEEVAQHPCECVAIEGDALRWALAPPEGASGRQAFPPFYYVNGAIYVTSVEFLRARRAFQDAHTVPYVMPRSRGLDINDLYDFRVAEGLIAVGNGVESAPRGTRGTRSES